MVTEEVYTWMTEVEKERESHKRTFETMKGLEVKIQGLQKEKNK